MAETSEPTWETYATVLTSRPDPFSLLIDGFTVPCPGILHGNDYTDPANFPVGTRCRVRIQNPNVPLILGLEMDGST